MGTELYETVVYGGGSPICTGQEIDAHPGIADRDLAEFDGGVIEYLHTPPHSWDGDAPAGKKTTAIGRHDCIDSRKNIAVQDFNAWFRFHDKIKILESDGDVNCQGAGHYNNRADWWKPGTEYNIGNFRIRPIFGNSESAKWFRYLRGGPLKIDQ